MELKKPGGTGAPLFDSQYSWRRLLLRDRLALVVKKGQHLVRMFLGLLYSGPMLDHVALWTDDDSGTKRPLHFLTVHHLFTEGRVFLHHLGGGIGQENVGQRVLFDKLVVQWNTIFADAQHRHVKFFELIVALTEPASLLGSAGGVVFWIEKQHDGLAFVIVE